MALTLHVLRRYDLCHTLVADCFECRKSAVTIKSGASGRVKLVHIEDASPSRSPWKRQLNAAERAAMRGAGKARTQWAHAHNDEQRRERGAARPARVT